MLHGRLGRLALPDLRHDVTWAQRTPADATAVARELAAALDGRARALGERLAASPEPWLARQLGVLAPGASTALREEYTCRAGVAAAYREAAGITNPDQAVSPEPHRNQPELEAIRKAVVAALEIRDEADILRGLDRGELETRALQGERARAAAPPDVSSQLRLTAQTEADALRQSADARAQHDHTGAARATVLAAQLAAARRRLEADNARYEKWSADSRSTREEAGKAEAELQRRENRQPEEGPQPQPNDQAQLIAGLWPDLGADIGAPEHLVVRQHQPVIDAREPWPPQRAPEPNPLSAHEPDPETSPEDESVLAQAKQNDWAARLDELLARADQAAHRVTADTAEQQASSEYAARLDREAEAEPEAEQQAEAWNGLEMGR